jgi:hypothetical protein
MVIPQLKSLYSPDLEPPALPMDASDCCILFQASIGPKDGEGDELFTFEVVTPRYLERSALPCWGRGLLIVDSFTWQSVGSALAGLLAQAQRESWRETAEALNHDLQWVIGSHTPSSGDD